LWQPAKSGTGTLTPTPSRTNPSSGKTDLPALKIPIHLSTATTLLTVLLTADDASFRSEVAEWVEGEQHEAFLPKSPFVQRTVTVMQVDPSHIVGATAEVAARAWPGQGIWHVVDSRREGDTAHITLLGDGWAGVAYYLAGLHAIISKSVVQIPGIKEVRFDDAPSP
jgi:hypothetical protein